MGTSHNKLVEKPRLESFLLWCWHSSTELCFESRHRKSIHLDLTGSDLCPRWTSSLLWLNRCVILLESVSGQVGVFHPSASTHDTVWESRNLPCHQDKDRNGVRLVLLKLCLSWPVTPAVPSPDSPPGQCSSVLELREGEDVNMPHTLISLNSLLNHTRARRII